MRHIELNLLRAGMAQDPADYPWSSHGWNALGRTGLNGNWRQPHEEYLRLGQTVEERRQAYRALFETEIATTDLARIRDSTHKGWARGDENFRQPLSYWASAGRLPKALDGQGRIIIVSDPAYLRRPSRN